jgi:hypothetical protein
MRRTVRNFAPDPVTNRVRRRDKLSERVFFSQNGELGLCPEGTQCGDVVVALYGGNVPLVVRPRFFAPGTSPAEQLRQGRRYELVGACYFYGAMKGEKMDSPHWQDPLYAVPLDSDPCIDPNGKFHRRGVYRTEVFYIE